MVTYVTVAESTLPMYTVAACTLVGSGFAMGELVLGIEAYFLRDWVNLQVGILDQSYRFFIIFKL
jgi:hypothetical protein